jgi:hypothetical protein
VFALFRQYGSYVVLLLFLDNMAAILERLLSKKSNRRSKIAAILSKKNRNNRRSKIAAILSKKSRSTK